jgi:hypothetical protein
VLVYHSRYDHYIAIGTNDTDYCAAILRVARYAHPTGTLQASVDGRVEPSLVDVGGRDSMIFQPRYSGVLVLLKYKNHEQEVCGLKWNDDGTCVSRAVTIIPCVCKDSTMSGQAAYIRRNFIRSTPPSRSRSTQGRHVKAFGLVSRTLGEWAVPRTEYQSFGTLRLAPYSSSIDTGSQVCSIVWHRHELCSSTAIPRTNSFCGSIA